MKYRPFKDVEVSEVGLGTWQLGSADWGEVDEEKALEILNVYVSHGGNFIDTADVYGMGISEKVIGKFIKDCPETIYVATKLGRRPDKERGWPPVYSYDYMRRQVDDSLTHLGVQQLFLEQLHCIPAGELKSGKVFGHFRKLQQEGLIRYWGASVETTEEAFVCMEQEGIASLQLIFNLFRQHIADELFERARERNIALIVRVPLASGLLTGKFNENTVFSKTDHRSYNANGEAFNAGETFSGIEFNKGVRLAREIAEYMPDERLDQWSVRWILDHPEITTVIPGASRLSQVNRNMEASTLDPLAPETHKLLRNLYDNAILPHIRGHF